MKQFFCAICLMFALVMTIMSVGATENKIWDFTTSAGMAEWTPNASIDYEVTADGTVFTSNEKDNDDMTLIYKNSFGEINLDDYEVFVVEYVGKTVGAGKRMQLYHWTESSSGNPRIDIDIESGNQVFKINMKNNAPETAQWSGKVTKLRFDPIRGGGARTVTVKSIGLFTSEEAYNEYLLQADPERLTKPGYVADPKNTYKFGTAYSKCFVTIDYINGYAVVTSTDGPEDGGNGDCNITDNADFNADAYPWIKMRIRNLSDATQFEFHFASDATDGTVKASSCTHFPISSHDTDFKEYVFNVKEYNIKSQSVNGETLTESVWSGNISKVRFDCMWLAEPSGQMPTGSQMYIDYIAFLPTEEAAINYKPDEKEDTVIDSGKESPCWILDTEEDVDAWSITNMNYEVAAGLAKFTPTTWDPQLSYSMQGEEIFDTAEFKYFAMYYKIKSTVGTGGLFYTTDTITSISDSTFSSFGINNNGEWSSLIVDMSSYPKQNWKGDCYSVRLDPINGAEDLKAEICIERLGFFRSKEEALAFLNEANTEPDYSHGTVYSGDCYKSIVPAGSLYDGYNKNEYLLTSTTPAGTGTDPVVIRTNADGSTEIVAMSYTNSYGFTTFVANKPATYSLGYNNKQYSDIADHWGKDYIDFVSNRTLFGGTSPTEFSPDMPMTRGMFITVLGRMHGLDTSKYDGNTGYGDVPATEYYAPYIQWAKEYNLMAGLSDVTFGAEDAIDRATMALVIANYCNTFDFTMKGYEDRTDFTDLANCDAATVEAIYAMQKLGILNGKGNGIFDPAGLSTRAEVAAVMQRVIKCALGVNMANTEYTSEYFQRKRLRLGVWGLEASQANEKGMDYLRDLGADLIVTGKATVGSDNRNYVLNYADKNGIEVFVQEFPTSTIISNDFDFDYNAYVAEYAEHPSFSGHYIIDEPGTDDYPAIAKLSSEYIEALPGKIPFTNLLPMYANSAQLKMGASAAAIEYYDADPDLYKKYCEAWFDSYDYDYICTDIYPLNWKGGAHKASNKSTYANYIESINQIATVARDNGKEFWCCIQTFGWESSKRTPTEAEYRWQCYSMLSFGCTGILLWRYIQGNLSLVNANTLEPQQAYYDCQAVMWEMRAISDVYIQYKNLGAFTHNSSSTPYLQMSGEYKNFDTITEIDCGEPLLIGCFEKEDKSGATAFTLVNMAEFSSEKGAVVKVKLADTAKAVTSYYRGEATVITPTDGYYVFELENGDGLFVTVE